MHQYLESSDVILHNLKHILMWIPLNLSQIFSTLFFLFTGPTAAGSCRVRAQRSLRDPPNVSQTLTPPPSTSHKSSNQNGCSICASSEFACCSRIVCGRHWHTSWIMNCLLAACEAAHTGCRAQKEGKFTARDGDKAGKRILSGAEKSEETLNLSPWGSGAVLGI